MLRAHSNSGWLQQPLLDTPLHFLGTTQVQKGLGSNRRKTFLAEALLSTDAER